MFIIKVSVLFCHLAYILYAPIRLRKFFGQILEKFIKMWYTEEKTEDHAHENCIVCHQYLCDGLCVSRIGTGTDQNQTLKENKNTAEPRPGGVETVLLFCFGLSAAAQLRTQSAFCTAARFFAVNGG